MAEVGGGEAIVSQQNAVAAQEADAAPAAMSFVDGDDANREAAILDEVLAGETDGAGASEGDGEAAAGADGDGAKPPAAAKPAEPKPETPTAEGAQLRKGFARLAEERQQLVQEKNALRAERQAVAQFAEKAQAHDALLKRLREDPAGVIAEMDPALIDKTLQGFIDREKSPAERETAKLRADIERDKAERLRQEQERVAADWRNSVTAKIQADERFDLVNTFGLHGDVINVITGYYEKHSERDDKGNVTVPAILDWAIAAQAVEEHREAMLGKSKRYGKRTPAAETPASSGKPKDAPTAKTNPGSAKKPPTSLSSVPVAEAPFREEELPIDDLDDRERRVLASLGL